MVNTGLCKKPFHRFEINRMISVKEAIDAIIKAQWQNIREISIPTYWFYINSLARCLPSSCKKHVRNFIKVGVHVPD